LIGDFELPLLIGPNLPFLARARRRRGTKRRVPPSEETTGPDFNGPTAHPGWFDFLDKSSLTHGRGW